VTNCAQRQGNPQDQDIPAASLNISRLSSTLKLDGQKSAGKQAPTTPQDQKTPEAALAAAHQLQHQLLQFISSSSASTTTPAPAPVATFTSAAAATTAASASPPSFQQPQVPTPPNQNLSQILALDSAIEKILLAHCQGSGMNQPALQQHQQPPQAHQHQQLLQHQTPAVDLKALASLLDPQTRSALVQWNQTQTSSELPSTALSVNSLLDQFAARQRQQHQQQHIAPFQPPPTQQSTNTSAPYSSDSLLRGQLASLQAVLKLQQQQQFHQHKWQEEERQLKRQQKLAQQQQLWLHQQVPHHPQNAQIIVENLTPTPTSTPNNMAQLLVMVAALQSQSSYPSR
jgi:hypothetical protein